MAIPKIIHESVTEERVIEGYGLEAYGTENPGFCLACGADHDACEPDACDYECYECGAAAVYGAAECIMQSLYNVEAGS